MPGLLEKRRSDREEGTIPTAGMADIAFLLLIFFLVTTTINVDTGIGMTLPPKLKPEQKPPPVKERNLMNVLVNASGDVLVDEERARVAEIRDRVKTHVLNFGEDPSLSASPDDAVISIKTDAATPYNTYIEVLDEVWMSYREIWDQIARTNRLPGPDGGTAGLEQTYSSYREYYNQLGPDEDNQIRDTFGAQISIAEPDTGE
ncbi:ExbD/TolR family protein [Salinibacter altiplanensis]|uniref:ExbD/TolR family protein n=1 Tax=Salinibacter altiplanensis TaxID=1803181 RepID=UPI000C9FA3BF|nr:biopolymer transporter ExbD [Salinibacter altiplanensis]